MTTDFCKVKKSKVVSQCSGFHACLTHVPYMRKGSIPRGTTYLTAPPVAACEDCKDSHRRFRFYNVAVSTSALHGKGPGFKCQRNHISIVDFSIVGRIILLHMIV